jgi:hypothetical protein
MMAYVNAVFCRCRRIGMVETPLQGPKNPGVYIYFLKELLRNFAAILVKTC